MELTQYFQKKIPQQNLCDQLLKVDKKILLVVGLDKKQLQLASYYSKSIVKLKLRWSYSNFKLVSIGFKQNLGLGCSNFYSRRSKWKNLKIFIYKNFVWARSAGSFEPPGLNVKPPMWSWFRLSAYYICPSNVDILNWTLEHAHYVFEKNVHTHKYIYIRIRNHNWKISK